MTTSHTLAFGALLKRYRLASGLTQAELAELAGLSPEAISALERGVNRAPRKDTVLLLADALKLPEQERALLESAARQHKLAAATSSSSHPQPAQVRSEPALVGRLRETALIQQVLAGTAPPAMFVAGEPGLGKTRLLHEAARLASNAGWSVLAGGCQRQGGQTPYAPLLTLVERSLLSQAPAKQQIDLVGCSWLVRLLPELAEMDVLPAPTWALPPEQERRLMFAAVSRFLANIAGPAGTLLILDDLHWAETDGCELLATLMTTTGSQPLRVIGAYRDTEVAANSSLSTLLADLAYTALATICALPPLDVAESETLLKQELEGAEQVETALTEQVVRQAAGIPFYLVSWAQALRSGALTQTTDYAVPWDIVQSVRQRVAVLPEIAREVLGIAAINGESTSQAIFMKVLGQSGRSEDDIITGLEASCQAKLLVEGADASYQLAELIRDVVAHDLSLARRTALHRRIAEMLEQEQGETATEALAYHFGRGGEPTKAILYLERAGDRATAMQAQTAAAAYYRELVERLDTLGRPVEAAHAREKLGRVLTTLTQYEQALTTLEQTATYYRTLHDSAALGQVGVLIGQAHADQGTAHEGLTWLQPLLLDSANAANEIPPQTLAALYDMQAQLLHVAGDYGQQLEVAQQAATYARSANDAALLCQIEMRRGNALRMLGRMNEASQVLEEVIQVASAAHDERTLAYALDNASGVYLLRGEFDKTVAYITQAHTLIERLGDPLMLALLVLRRGMNIYLLGEWKEAGEDFEQAQAMTTQLGVSWVSAYTALGLGQLRLVEGDWQRATGLLEEAVQRANQSGDLQALRWAQTALAEYELMQGQAAAARARLEPLLDRPGQQEGLVTYLLPYLAWACLELNEVALAESYIQHGLARAAGEEIRLAWVDAFRVSAQLLMRQERFAEAAAALNRGLELSREMRFPYGEARMQYTFGLLHRQQQRPEQARQALLAAQSILTTLGERLYNERIVQMLATLK